jgi:uncharacterized membrane protein
MYHLVQQGINPEAASEEGMHFATTIEIAAPREVVWATLIDVERWHEWTKSVTSIELLTTAPFSASSKLRIKQPRLQALEWNVTEFVPNEAFTWTSTTFGITSVGSHRITAGPHDRVTVTLALRQTGFLASLVGLLTARVTRRYIDMEANGLKARSEARASTPGR